MAAVDLRLPAVPGRTPLVRGRSLKLRTPGVDGRCPPGPPADAALAEAVLGRAPGWVPPAYATAYAWEPGAPGTAAHWGRWDRAEGLRAVYGRPGIRG
eukprot:2844021-Pyramimonas_sp.AAC.1